MDQAVEIETSENGKNLYIFFGGIAAGIAMPPFEFYNASKLLEENKIFIRDFSQSWYLNGLFPVTNDIYSSAKSIENMINEINPETLYMVGNSMGGYAAILFSCLIGRGEVIAFAPQTFISPILRIKNRDQRWARQILRTYRKTLFKPKIMDLRPLIISCANPSISIFVSVEDKLDSIHASHVKNLNGVTVHEIEGGGHGVVKLLRDQGKLPEIMSGKYRP